MPEVLLSSSRDITTAVVFGLKAQDVQVKRAAAYALENAIDFCAKHFDTPTVRHQCMRFFDPSQESQTIMATLLEALTFPDEDLQCACLVIFIDVAFMHYEALEPFMTHLFKVTQSYFWTLIFKGNHGCDQGVDGENN